ncbi:retropepsin-like domain-containing protein [candidate division WOR-3 bacterium]|nr:retropepsin-like domain-containing protein [candidate division WOR-3 bacterium]
MTEIPFDPSELLIICRCKVEYKKSAIVNLAIDTGASRTLLNEDVIQGIGVDLSSVSEKDSFSDASTDHIVPVVRLKSISLGDATIKNMETLVYNLPGEFRIDGVLGLNFLRHFKVNLDFDKCILSLERI